jgi:hypothetical protein
VDSEPSPSPRRSKKSALGAAMLGAGAILQPKVDPEEHWSTSPKIVLVVEEEASANAEPVSIDFDSVPDSPVRSPRLRRRRRWFRRQ